jgi:hypothetical protein
VVGGPDAVDRRVGDDAAGEGAAGAGAAAEPAEDVVEAAVRLVVLGGVVVAA